MFPNSRVWFLRVVKIGIFRTLPNGECRNNAVLKGREN